NREGFHLVALWQSAHCVTLFANSLVNWPPWTSSWHSSHFSGAFLKSTFMSLVSMFGGLWQSMQATARCAPARGNDVVLWSNPSSSFQDFVEWQDSQPIGFPFLPILAMRSWN